MLPRRRCGTRLINAFPASEAKKSRFQIGLDVARAECVDANAVARPFPARGFWTSARHRTWPWHRPDRFPATRSPRIDAILTMLPPVPASTSLCPAALATRNTPGEIGVDDVRPFVLGGLQRLAVDRDTRVVDHDVESAALEYRGHAGGVGHVQSRSLRRSAVAFDLRAEAPQPVDTPCCRGDLGALLGQNPREMSPETGRRGRLLVPLSRSVSSRPLSWTLATPARVGDQRHDRFAGGLQSLHEIKGIHSAPTEEERRGSIDALLDPPSQRDCVHKSQCGSRIEFTARRCRQPERPSPRRCDNSGCLVLFHRFSQPNT